MIIKTEPKIWDAICTLCPGATWHFKGDTYEDLVWTDTQIAKPSKSDVLQELQRLKDEYAKNEYFLNRKKEYPSIGDQLDALFKAGVFPEEMAAQIQAIKDKYPKPE